VEFAELEYVLERQSQRLDHPAGQQWHHETIGSTNAWAISLGYSPQREPLVRLAILDTPFQMDHPDLRDHAVPGWSLLTRSELPLETNGYYHSTLAAGLAGAVLKNGLGVAGAVNCFLVPVDIGNLPTTRDMHDAVVWAADHGIRVVNLSWGGAFSSVINEAGLYLKQKARGMLFMAGMNEQRFLNYPEHPHIYAISMTDRNDQARSAWGEHIDFSAPGWDIYSTTTNSGYETDSGTSYSAPLAAGVAAWIMSADPALEPDEIEGILRETCVDLGEPGRDQRHGWGRIDFGRAARRVYERSAISRVKPLSDGAEAVHEAGTAYRLLRAADVRGPWEALTNVQQEPGGGRLKLRDLEAPGPAAFYQVEITRPQ
jgi:subtilisin family serine protease